MVVITFRSFCDKYFCRHRVFLLYIFACSRLLWQVSDGVLFAWCVCIVLVAGAQPHTYYTFLFTFDTVGIFLCFVFSLKVVKLSTFLLYASRCSARTFSLSLSPSLFLFEMYSLASAVYRIQLRSACFVPLPCISRQKSHLGEVTNTSNAKGLFFFFFSRAWRASCNNKGQQRLKCGQGTWNLTLWTTSRGQTCKLN